jgi:uncharacterized protein (DUF1501 family)
MHYDPLAINRRHFFGKSAASLGGLALSSLLNPSCASDEPGIAPEVKGFPNHSARAKRVIYLFQAGGPGQHELFDHKPLLNKLNGQQLPESVRKGQRLTGMSSSQSSIPIAGSLFQFQKHGQCGAEISELLPYHHKIADDICILKAVHTDAINHDPAITFFQTGSQIAGRPCIGSWLSYGIGSLNANLPAFVVMVSANGGGQPLYSRLWSSGFLNTRHEGVLFQGSKDPVLYLSNPDGVDAASRRKMLDKLNALNRERFQQELDPEIESRIAQYEMAYRMQTSVPEVADLSQESEKTFELYGPDSKKPGTYAANCLMARRLVERGVRFIQLYHQGWDHHDYLPRSIKADSKKTDQASAALVMDLKQRGLLDDTLVVWGGEFGRTCYSQGLLTHDNYGRDHHPRCFSMWLAGGGVKPGFTFGETCEFGFNVVKDGMHVFDFQATLMHLLGIDHERLTYQFQGRRFRLTDVHGEVVKEILA